MSKHLQIKICGITNLEDAIYSSNLGANYLGLIFVPKTKRHLEIDKLKELAMQIKKNCPKTKLVLVTKLEYLKELENTLELFDIVQIHDKYDKEIVAWLKHKDLEVWQLAEINQKIKEFDLLKSGDPNISQFLIDKPKSINMNHEEYLDLLKTIDFPTNFVLAGQIGIDNLTEFLQFKPKIIDICSSVESHFGSKSKFKLTQFFQQINNL
jgi:phosphoribosylanthranilate isomerase